MYARGVGGGSSGVTHELSEDVQGTYHYTIGPYSAPVLHVAPGDRVVVETRDAFEGKITRESDVPSEILEMPWLNPQCGPIMVDGAEKGRRAGRSHREDAAERSQPARHLLHDQGVRSAHRHHPHRHPQRAAAGKRCARSSSTKATCTGAIG